MLATKHYPQISSQEGRLARVKRSLLQLRYNFLCAIMQATQPYPQILDQNERAFQGLILLLNYDTSNNSEILDQAENAYQGQIVYHNYSLVLGEPPRFTPHTADQAVNVLAGNTKGGSITVPLTSRLTSLDQSVFQVKTKIVSSQTADSKPVKQEVNGTVILPPFSIPWFYINFSALELRMKENVYEISSCRTQPSFLDSQWLQNNGNKVIVFRG